MKSTVLQEVPHSASTSQCTVWRRTAAVGMGRAHGRRWLVMFAPERSLLITLGHRRCVAACGLDSTRLLGVSHKSSPSGREELSLIWCGGRRSAAGGQGRQRGAARGVAGARPVGAGGDRAAQPALLLPARRPPQLPVDHEQAGAPRCCDLWCAALLFAACRLPVLRSQQRAQ